MIIGLAGKYCAGKNSLVCVFEARGFEIVDADRLGHEALEDPETKELVLKRFGTQVANAEGRIDRRKLGALVFSHPRELAALESLVHPWILRTIMSLIGQAQKPHVLINAALLHKVGLHRVCDAVVWVKAPLLTRLARAGRRDRLGFFRILQRVWTQRHLSANAFSQDVDTYIVDNRSTLERARGFLEGLLNRLGI